VRSLRRSKTAEPHKLRRVGASCVTTVVKLRYFGGMTNEEVAQALNISVSIVKTYWQI
jgi:hypothetical protein